MHAGVNPCKFMFVVVQMYNAAAWNVRKLLDKRPVYFALHFDCAYHIEFRLKGKPFFNPFKKSFRVADYIRKYPVYRTKLFRLKGKGIVSLKGYQRVCHQTVCEWGAVYGVH